MEYVLSFEETKNIVITQIMYSSFQFPLLRLLYLLVFLSSNKKGIEVIESRTFLQSFQSII